MVFFVVFFFAYESVILWLHFKVKQLNFGFYDLVTVVALAQINNLNLHVATNSLVVMVTDHFQPLCVTCHRVAALTLTQPAVAPPGVPHTVTVSVT